MPASRLHSIQRHLRDLGPAATGRTCVENLLGLISTDSATRFRERWIRRQNLAFDRRFGTATAEPAPSEVPADGIRYEPTDAASFEWFLERVPANPASFTFVDIGSGRGKVAILAARAGFDRVLGVEFNPELVDSARDNVARALPTRRRDRVRFVVGDATRIDPPPGPLLVWSFNPFGSAMLERMLDRFESSWRADPREMIFGYYNAMHPGAFDRPWLRPLIPSTPLLIGHLVASRSGRPPA